MPKLIPIKVSAGFLSPVKLDRANRNFMKAAAENIRIDFGVVTQTWAHKPKFLIELVDPYTYDIYTNSEVNGKPIFKFISGGTRVRYATMSADWVSKTQPNVLGSGQGAGRMMFVSRNRPHPGIVARNFPHIIILKWQPRLPGLYVRMIADALAR